MQVDLSKRVKYRVLRGLDILPPPNNTDGCTGDKETNQTEISVMSRRRGGPGKGGMDISVIRRANLRKLTDQMNDKTGKGGQRRLADRLGVKPVYVSQLIGRTPTRPIGGRTARRVENLLDLPYGWMDQTHRFDLAEQPPTRTVPVIGEFGSAELKTAMGKGDMEFLRRLETPGEVLHVHSEDVHAYAMRVMTDEFTPRIYPGELIALEPSTVVAPGDEVLIFTKRREMLLRQVLSMLEREVIVSTIVQSDKRWPIRRSEILHMHYLAGVFRPRSTRILHKV